MEVDRTQRDNTTTDVENRIASRGVSWIQSASTALLILSTFLSCDRSPSAPVVINVGPVENCLLIYESLDRLTGTAWAPGSLVLYAGPLVTIPEGWSRVKELEGHVAGGSLDSASTLYVRVLAKSGSVASSLRLSPQAPHDSPEFPGSWRPITVLVKTR